MTIRRISSGPGLPAGFPFSLASEGNGILFVSGMPALDADIGNYSDFNSWWRRQFPHPAQAPARLTYQAGALPFGAKIELQAVAARPDHTS